MALVPAGASSINITNLLQPQQASLSEYIVVLIEYRYGMSLEYIQIALLKFPLV